MKKISKILLPIAGVTFTAAPLITLVSCGAIKMSMDYNSGESSYYTSQFDSKKREYKFTLKTIIDQAKGAAAKINAFLIFSQNGKTKDEHRVNCSSVTYKAGSKTGSLTKFEISGVNGIDIPEYWAIDENGQTFITEEAGVEVEFTVKVTDAKTKVMAIATDMTQW